MQLRSFASAFTATIASVAAAQEPLSSEHVLPTRRCGNLFIVDAKINDKGPFALVVDTGCASLVLDAGAAKLLGSSQLTNRTTTGTGAHGKDVTATVVTGIESVRVGDISLAPGSTVSIDMAALRQAMRSEIDGMLGFDAFRQLVLILDFPAGQIRVRERSIGAEEATSRLWIRRGTPEVDVRIGSHHVQALLDSGNNRGLKIADADVFPVQSGWQTVGVGVAADGAQLVRAGRLVRDVQLAGMTLSQPIVEVGSGGVSIVGCEVLKDFVWTIDQRRGCLQVKPAASHDAKSPPVRGTGAAIVAAEGGLKVVDVSDHSPAAKSGLLSEDLIVRINGKLFSTFVCSEAEDLMRSSKSLQLTIRRGEQELEKTVEVIDIIP